MPILPIKFKHQKDSLNILENNQTWAKKALLKLLIE